MRWIRSRKRLVWFVAVWIVISVGVALAVFLGSADIPGNNAQTGELTPQTVLSVGLWDPQTVTTEYPCERVDLVYEEVSSQAAFGGTTLDYASRGVDNIVAVGGNEVCVRNDSNIPVRVDVVISSISSQEVGTCPDAVEAAAGDTTCGTDEGELGSGELTLWHEALGYWGSFSGGAGTFCSANPSVSLTAGAATTGIAVLDPGGSCYFSLYLTDSRVDPSVSSTDDVTFTIEYQADNDTATGP